MVFKITKLDKFTKRMNVNREESLGCDNTNSSGRRRGTGKRDQDRITRKTGGKLRECSVLEAK